MKLVVPKVNVRGMKSNAHVYRGKSFQCNKKGNWRRNCTRCLNNHGDGIKGIELFVCETSSSISVFSMSWILDSSASSYICTLNQDLVKN